MINTWPGWETVCLLGEGSFGKVYKVQREEFGVTYEAALKVITIPASRSDVKAAYEEGMDDASVTKYFHSFVEDIVAEFALMSQLKGNSNIVSYEDHMVVPHEGEVGWDILIRMELLTALPDYIRKHPLTEEDVVRLGIDLARALTICRKRGIIHRDIKPENIFVSKDGDFKLGDFGVARVAEKTVSAMSRKGTYNYMAPEVYRGEKYGYSADIYSLGLVLYRLLNDNRTPFLPPYPTQIQYSDREKALDDRMTGQPVPEPAHGSDSLKKIVLKACAYKPEDRYESAEEMKEALEELTKKPAGQAAPEEQAAPPAEETEGKKEEKQAEEMQAEEKQREKKQREKKQGEEKKAAMTQTKKTERKSGKEKPEKADHSRKAADPAPEGKKIIVKRKRTPSIVIVLIALVAMGITVAAVRYISSKASDSRKRSEIVAMLDQPTDPEQLQERAALKEAFDQRLAGCWYRYDTVYQGETKLSFSGISYLSILETGEYYLGNAKTYAELETAGLDLPRMTAEENRLNWLPSYMETYQNITNYKNDTLFPIYDSLHDLQVTYEIFDCQENPSNPGSAFQSYFAAYPDDGLAIHITAVYEESAFSEKTIDETLYFYRYYPLNRDNYFLPSIEGRWEDNLGNVWVIRIDTADTEAGFTMEFAMKDAAGTIHEGDWIYTSYQSDECVETIRFYFEDNLVIPEYTIVSYDGDTLSLADEKGTELILTRK